MVSCILKSSEPGVMGLPINSAQELHKHDAGGEMTDAVKIVNETMQRQKI